MAEAVAAIGLASSILQLLDFSGKVAARLNEFQSNSQDLSGNLKPIKVQLPLILNAVKRIQEQAQDELVSEPTAKALQTVMKDCKQAVLKLDGILTKIIPPTGASSWQRRAFAFKSLAYDKDIQRTISHLDRNISVLTLHQATATAELSRVVAASSANQSLTSNATPTSSQPPQRKAIFMVPFPRDSLFVGREDVLAKITDDMSVQQGRIALVGIGGVGKSQIAIEYCYRYRSEHPDHHIFWAMCSSFNRFEEAYKNIARRLDLPVSREKGIEVLQVVLEWLNENGPWLMVLDNADDKDVLFGPDSQVQRQQPSPAPLAKYIPYSSAGAMLITSRDRSVGESIVNRPAKSVTDVMPFSENDARQLLRNKSTESDLWPETETLELLSHLNYLPLALAQAAAYIREERLSLSLYLGLLRPGGDDAKVVFERSFYDPARDQEIRNSIFQTWTLSFDQIRRRQPRAARMLSLMANLDRQAVPDVLLRNEDESNVNFTHAVSTLMHFSLIAVSGDKQASHQMHRLVQIATQRWLENQGSLSEWQGKALGAVIRCCPPIGNYESWEHWEAVLPHAQTVLGYSFTGESHLLQRAHLLRLVADLENCQSRYASAEARASEAVQITCNLLGDEDESTLRSLHVKARAISHQGRSEQAEDIYHRVLDIRRQRLGGDDVINVYIMHDIALEKVQQTKYEVAKTLLRENLAICQRKLGNEHALTLHVMVTLASTMAKSGEVEEAELMLHEALGLYPKVELEKDIHAFYSKRVLAVACLGIGDYEEAINKFGMILIEYERCFPKDHSDIIQVMSYLGSTLLARGQELGNQGQQKEATAQFEHAEQVLRSALASTERTVGLDNPIALELLRFIMYALSYTKKCDQAEEIYRLASKLSNELHGPEDHITQSIAIHLAACYLRNGRYQEAVDILRPLVKLRITALGYDKEKTHSSVSQLAECFFHLGLYHEPEEMLRLAVAKQIGILGNESRLTLETMRNLGVALGGQRKLDEAEAMLQSTARMVERIHGEESEEAMNCNNVLVFILANADHKQFVQGREMAQRLVTRRIELLGEEDMQTLWMMGLLTGFLVDPAANCEDYTEAKEHLEKTFKLQSKILGDHHEQTLFSLRKLLQLYSAHGKPEDFDRLSEIEVAINARLEREKEKQEEPGRILEISDDADGRTSEERSE